jgi:general secretion pathway protein I
MAHNDSGFTLLEVLVATIIAGLALAVLFGGAVDGLHATRISAHYQEALARARSRLATIGREAPLVDADRQGDDGGGFQWHTRVRTVATAPLAALGGSHSPRAVLHDVEVKISWRSDGGDREIVLHTERTGLAAPAPP